MSFVIVSWEVSTSLARQAAITAAAEAALAPFNPARLLTASALIDTDQHNVVHVRRALDGIRAAFPEEFFYTSADQAASDLQGIYPPFAELDRARATTGSQANPRERAGATVAAARGAVSPEERRAGGRRRAAPERARARRGRGPRKPRRRPR